MAEGECMVFASKGEDGGVLSLAACPAVLMVPM